MVLKPKRLHSDFFSFLKRALCFVIFFSLVGQDVAFAMRGNRTLSEGDTDIPRLSRKSPAPELLNCDLGVDEGAPSGGVNSIGPGDAHEDEQSKNPFADPAVKKFVEKHSFQQQPQNLGESLPLYFSPDSIDQKDYIRLLNMRQLLLDRREEINRYRTEGKKVTLERRLKFLFSLSRQADGLSSRVGYIRHQATPSGGPRQSVWRRLCYMYHGLLLDDLNPDLRNDIVNAIWENRKPNRAQKKCEKEDTEDTEQQEMETKIPDQELDSFLELELFLEELIDVESDRAQLERMRREWPFRIDEVWNGYWFLGGSFPDRGSPFTGSTLLGIPDDGHVDSVKAALNAIYKNPSLSIGEKFKRGMRAVRGKFQRTGEKRDNQGGKGKKAKFKKRKTPSIEQVCDAVESAVEKKQKDIDKKIKSAHKKINLENIRFYMGLVNEYENLQVAERCLSSFIEQADPEDFSLGSFFQVISVIAEALNNTMPIQLAQQDEIKLFHYTLLYLRNKVCEHPKVLQYVKYKDFLRHQIARNEKIHLRYPIERDPTISEICRRIVEVDLPRLLESLQFRSSIMNSLIRNEGGQSSSKIADIRHQLTIQKVKKYFSATLDEKKYIKMKSPDELLETDLWTCCGLPTLEGLSRYFFHQAYSLDNVLVMDFDDLKALSRIIYASEQTCRPNLPKWPSMRQLLKEVQKLRYFLPVYYDRTEYLNILRKAYHKEFISRINDPSLKYYINLFSFDTEAIEEGSPVLALTEQPASISSDLIKLQVLHRIIGDIYECMDALVSSEGAKFFEFFELRHRNILRYLYQDLRDRRNFFTHDLWRVYSDNAYEAYKKIAEETAAQIISVLGGTIERVYRFAASFGAPRNWGAVEELFRLISGISPGKSDLNLDWSCEEKLIEAVRTQADPETLKEQIEILIRHVRYFGIRDFGLFRDNSRMNSVYKTHPDIASWYGYLSDPTEGINFIDPNGMTALHYAAGISDPEIIKLLIESGSFIHLKNDRGESALDILERRLNMLMFEEDKDKGDVTVTYPSSPQQRSELHVILQEQKENSPFQKTEIHDEPHRSVSTGNLERIRDEIERVYSINTYDSKGRTLIELARKQHCPQDTLDLIYAAPGVDASLVTLRYPRASLSVTVDYERGYPFYRALDSEDPRNFLAEYEMPVETTKGQLGHPLAYSVKPTRAGYYREGKGFGDAHSPNSGLADTLMNGVINSMSVQLGNIFAPLGRLQGLFHSSRSGYENDYQVARRTTWTPRWTFGYLEENHSLSYPQVLPLIGSFEGSKRLFQIIVTENDLKVLFEGALDTIQSQKPDSELRASIGISIAHSFKACGLPRGLLYPRHKERMILSDLFRSWFPDSITNSTNLRGLRASITYACFLMKFLKKWIAADSDETLKFKTTDEFVQHIKGTHWDSFSEILTSLSDAIDSTQKAISEFFNHSSLFLEYIDFCKDLDNLLDARSYHYRKEIFQAIADVSAYSISIWKYSSDVGDIDIEIESQFTPSGQSVGKIHLLDPTNNPFGKGEESSKLSVLKIEPETLDEKALERIMNDLYNEVVHTEVDPFSLSFNPFTDIPPSRGHASSPEKLAGEGVQQVMVKEKKQKKKAKKVIAQENPTINHAGKEGKKDEKGKDTRSKVREEKNESKLTANEKIEQKRFRKFSLKVRAGQVLPQEICDSYCLIPTVPDGNCFFHAIATQEGQTREAVDSDSTNVRDVLLPQSVNANMDLMTMIKKEVLGRYKQRYHDGQYQLIPKVTLEKIKSNYQYEELREVASRMSADSLPDSHQGFLLGIQNTIAPPFDEDHLLESITTETVNTYLQKYQSGDVRASNPECFIEIPVAGDSASSGTIICFLKNIRANCFLRNGRHLNYTCTIGPEDAEHCVNILCDSNHFSALYNKALGIEEALRCWQIYQNRCNYDEEEASKFL